MESMGISGYTVLRSLSDIGVRLDDMLDPVIRSHIPLSPEKSKVLFRMVDDLGWRYVASCSSGRISII